MDLQQLAVFAAVARYRSLTRASVELGRSQPALSRDLRLLQDRFGARLFRRVWRGIQVTAAGEDLLRKARPLLEQMSALDQALQPAAAVETQPVLRAGGTCSASAELLPRLLAAIQRRCPDARISIRTRNSDQLERLVLSGDMELAVTARPVSNAALICEPYRRAKLALFVLAGHRLARKQVVTREELLKEPFVMPGTEGSVGAIGNALDKLSQGPTPVKVAMFCDGPVSIIAAVRQKMGVASSRLTRFAPR